MTGWVIAGSACNPETASESAAGASAPETGAGSFEQAAISSAEVEISTAENRLNTCVMAHPSPIAASGNQTRFHNAPQSPRRIA
ncbi:MAG: hypothetical protein R3E86_06165 [Pseudomonadales bacterium]